MAETANLLYPEMTGPGIMHLWEATVGTNPHIYRPRKAFPSGFVNRLYERVRSAVIHFGLGTIISSVDERRTVREGLKVGHLHLYFPTYMANNEPVVDNGHVLVLYDPEIRTLAQKYGKFHDPILWLEES